MSIDLRSPLNAVSVSIPMLFAIFSALSHILSGHRIMAGASLFIPVFSKLMIPLPMNTPKHVVIVLKL